MFAAMSVSNPTLTLEAFSLGDRLPLLVDEIRPFIGLSEISTNLGRIDSIIAAHTGKSFLNNDNFTFDEFVFSATARRHNLRNWPTHPYHYINASYLVSFLQDIRTLICLPITVNSGYRNSSLNALVKGQPRSKHLMFRAADICCRDNIALFSLLKTFPHTELIQYKTFIHFAI